MEVLEIDDFLEQTFGGRPNRANMGPYFGKSYDCACGKSHNIDASTSVIRELSGMRFVIVCPERDNFYTRIKISGLFNIKITSLFGGTDR